MTRTKLFVTEKYKGLLAINPISWKMEGLAIQINKIREKPIIIWETRLPLI